MGSTIGLLWFRFGPWIVLLWAATHASNESCNNRCQLQDETTACFEDARAFFAHQLAKAANEYAAVTLMIHQWHHHHGTNDSWEETLPGVMKDALESVDGPLNEDNLLPVLMLIGNQTEKLVDSEESYPISCPIPCNYINTLWIYLFICACIVIVLSIPIMLLHVYYSRKNFLKYQLS